MFIPLPGNEIEEIDPNIQAIIRKISQPDVLIYGVIVEENHRLVIWKEL
jgi:hypothetical protein